MKGNKSTGDDDISARFIKLAGPFQTLGKWQELPQSIKNDISNYRPISILPIAY